MEKGNKDLTILLGILSTDPVIDIAKINNKTHKKFQ